MYFLYYWQMYELLSASEIKYQETDEIMIQYWFLVLKMSIGAEY